MLVRVQPPVLCFPLFSFWSNTLAKRLIIVDGNSIHNHLIDPFTGKDDKTHRIDFEEMKKMFEGDEIVWLTYHKTRKLFEKFFKTIVFRRPSEIPFLIGKLVGENPDVDIIVISFFNIPLQFENTY